jgi:hypothetical protein
MSAIFYARRLSVKRKMALGELSDGDRRDFPSGNARPRRCAEPRPVRARRRGRTVAGFYPARRLIIRLDAGDTMIRLRRATRNGSGQAIQTSNDFTHHLPVGHGCGCRF